MGFFDKLAEAHREATELSKKDTAERRKREEEERKRRTKAIMELQERERRNKR